MRTILHRKPFSEQLKDNLSTAWRWKGKIPDPAFWRLVGGLLSMINKYGGKND